MALLEVRNLSVRFATVDGGTVCAVNDISLSVDRGEVLGIVGESGSGKSQTWLGVMGLLARNGRAAGSACFDGRELLGLSHAALNQLRGARMGMIFQDPMTALNPFLSVGRQMTEVLQRHRGMGRREAEHEAIAALEMVHITDAPKRLGMHPHEFSGGMRQRVMIAMTMLTRPDVLICDEPTTFLDVTVQRQILALLDELRQRFNTAIVFITHDLGVIAEIADRVIVMYGGRVMEQADVHTLFANYRHPYTEGLLRSVPRPDVTSQGKLATIAGNPPDLAHLPAGCPFAPRCVYRQPRCDTQMPDLLDVGPDHWRACHHVGALGKLQAVA